jgi:hypothetical protein
LKQVRISGGRVITMAAEISDNESDCNSLINTRVVSMNSYTTIHQV